MTEAQSFLDRGNPDEAIRILANHLHSYPNDTSAQLLLASAYVVAGRTAEAEEQYQKVIQRTPDNYIALAGLGEVYERTGRLEKAEPILARAVRLSHGVPRVRTQWATVLARLHRYPEASRALAGLVAPKIRDERIAFYRLRASVFAGLGNSSRAASEMEQALTLNPNDVQLRTATAAAQVQAGQWQRAADLARPLFASTHDPGVGLLLLEAELGNRGNIHPTLESFQHIDMAPEREAAFRQRVAELLISRERLSDAVHQLKRAAELAPDRADLLFNLALVQFKAGRLEDGLATAKRCKGLVDSAELEDLLGDLQEASQDNLAAVSSYQAAIALAPNEEKYHLSLALEFMRHKNFEPARVVLSRAEELHPDSWRIQLALGMVEYFAGSESEAIRFLMRAAELAPQPEPALEYLGDILMDRASVPDPAALSHLCSYADAHPKSGKTQYYCGALLFRRDYLSHDKSHFEEIVRRLNVSLRATPGDAAAHCQLGKAWRWIERWQDALQESRICAQMDSRSADAHYRLAQIYQHLGQAGPSQSEMKLYEASSQSVADENARRDQTMKTFLYTIQNDLPYKNKAKDR